MKNSEFDSDPGCQKCIESCSIGLLSGSCQCWYILAGVWILCEGPWHFIVILESYWVRHLHLNNSTYFKICLFKIWLIIFYDLICEIYLSNRNLFLDSLYMKDNANFILCDYINQKSFINLVSHSTEVVKYDCGIGVRYLCFLFSVWVGRSVVAPHHSDWDNAE